MERIGFLLPGGKRLECLLNPEDIEVTRTSGAQTRRTIGASQAGVADPLQRTSGGTTRLKLKVLFDVMLPEVYEKVLDVRELTERLWELSETSGTRLEEKDKVRFMWGKYWNIPGDIDSITEKLENFSADGAPRRAWVSLDFVADVAPQSIRKESRRR